MKTKREIELVDCDGKPHKYRTIQFGAVEGMELLPVVVTCIAEPLGKAINAFTADPLGTKAQAQAEEDDATDVPSGSLLDQEFDAAKVGQALSEMAVKLASAGGPDLCMKILRHTVRDGEKLGISTNFDSAYQGNYIELFKALGWVLQMNYATSFKKMSAPFDLGSLLTGTSSQD